MHTWKDQSSSICRFTHMRLQELCKLLYVDGSVYYRPELHTFLITLLTNYITASLEGAVEYMAYFEIVRPLCICMSISSVLVCIMVNDYFYIVVCKAQAVLVCMGSYIHVTFCVCNYRVG